MTFCFVEPCAGFASVTLHMFGAKPPCSRVGAKTGYARAILSELGLTGQRPEEVVLLDTDRALTNALAWLLTRPHDLAQRIDGFRQRCASEGSRAVWEDARVRVRRPADPDRIEWAAAFWVHAAGARGGIGGFKWRHKLRPSVRGFIPTLPALVTRIASMPRLHEVAAVRAVPGDAGGLTPQRGSMIYLDPPYAGTLCYTPADLTRARVLRLARSWAAAGCLVAVSERVPLELEGARHVDITRRRVGQRRRSLTRSTREWLTIVDGR